MPRRSFWSEDELDLLERHAEERGWFRKVRPQLRGRTDAAIRKQMANIRADLGMSDRRLESWQRDAVQSSELLLSALRSAGYPCAEQRQAA